MPEIHSVILPNGYTITDDRARLDMALVLDAVGTCYWAVDRPRALTERSWANSLCFGVYDPVGRQVGCGRVLTDYALRAHIADVVIDPAARGLGLGTALIVAMLDHPALTTVTHWTLTTLDAHSIYAKFNFVAGVHNPDWMTMQRRPSGPEAVSRAAGP